MTDGITWTEYANSALGTNVDALAKLREKFPPESVGKLPRISCTDCTKADGKVCSKHKKQKCAECGNYISTAHLHLDYVGHAETTDRLLTADPGWNWEPFALDANGLPALDREGNLWIRLTIAGVTRPGVGDGPDMKQRIGDAIRNASMRFGVALDLWAKSDLESRHDETPTPPPASDEQVVEFATLLDTMDAEQKEALRVYFHEQQIPRIAQASRDQASAGIAEARRVIAVRHEPTVAYPEDSEDISR